MTSSSHDQPTYEPDDAVHTNTTTTTTSTRDALFDQSASSHGGRLRCPPQLMHPVGSPPRLMPTPPQPALPSTSLPFTGPSYRLACSPPPPPPLSSTSSSASPRPMPSFARVTPELTMSQHPMCRGNTAHKIHELGAIPGSSTSLTNTPNSQNKLSNSSNSSTARDAIREGAHNNNNNSSSTSSGSALSHQTRPQSSPGSTTKMNGTKSDKLVMMMKSAVEGREKKTRTAAYVANSNSNQNAAATDKTAASASFSSSSSSSTARAAGSSGIAAIPYMSRPAFTRSESSNTNNNMAGGSSSGGNDTAGYAARPMPYCMTTTSTTTPTITTSCNTNRSMTSGASPATLLLPSQPPPPPILSSSSSSTGNIVTAGCASLHHGSLSTAGMSSQATAQPKAFLFNTSAKLVSEDARFQDERVGQAENAATDVDAAAAKTTSMSSCQSGSPEKRSSRSAATTTLRRSLPTSPPQTTGPDQFVAGSVSSCQVGASYETALRPLLHGPSPPPTAPPTQDTARSHTRLANLLNVAVTATTTTEKPPPLLSALKPTQDHTLKGTTSSGAPQYLTVNSYDAAGQKKNTSTCSALPSPSLEGLVSYVSTTNTALTSPTEAVAATGHEGTTTCAPFTSAQRGVVDSSRNETTFAEATRNAGDSVTSSSLPTTITTNNNTPAASVTAMRRVKRRPASLFISPQSVPQGENSQLHFSGARSTTLLAGETADNKEPSGVLRARALSAHALYDSRNQTPAQEPLDSMTRQGKEVHTAPPLQPMNAFDPASQPHQALNTISFITTANPADNGLTNTQDTTSTAVQAPRQDGSSSTVQLGSPYAMVDPTTRTLMSMSDGNGAAMPHGYAPGSATSSATFSPSPMTQELPNLSSLPTLGAMPRLDLAAVYMPSSMQNNAKVTQNDNDGESEVERASIPYSALRALQAAHQCSMMTSEAFRPMGNTGAFTTTVQDNLEGKATVMSGLNNETLNAGQPAMMRPLTVPPALFAATVTNMRGGQSATLQGELGKKSEREGTGMGLGIVTEHRDATAMMEQHHKQSPLLQQQYNHIRSPHFASPDSTVAASATVAHRKAVAPAPLCQDKQTQRRPRHYGRRHRRPLVRLAHDGKTLIAGDFRVCEMGCLTICNFLLLNPQHSQHHPQQQQERVSNAATMPQLGEMRAGDGVALAAATTFTVDGTSNNRGPGPLLRPERLRGMSASSNNVRGDTIPVCANMHATLSKSDVYGEARQAKPGPVLTRLDSGGSYVVAQAPCTTTATNSSNKGNSNAMMMASGPHNPTTTSATTAIVPDILLRSPAPSSPAITPTSVALTPDALLCPCTSPGLLMMEEAEMDYGMTSTALPGDTPAMATITPARTRGRSGTMPENASFTLQSTSMNMPYSPITYSMDSLHYPETMTPCTSKLGRSGTATQTRRLLRAHRELTPGLPQARFSGSLTNLVAQDAEPPLSRTLGSAPHHGIVPGNMPGTPSCLRPPSSSHHHNQQQPQHAMTPLTASSAAPVLLQPQSSNTAFGSGLRVFRRCSSGGLNNYNMNNAGGSGLPPQSPMSCLPAALALPSAKCTRLGSFNNTTNNNPNTASGVGLMMGSSTSMLMPSATAVSRAPTVTNASLTPHGGDTPTSCTAGPLLPQATQTNNTILMMSHAEDSVVAGSLLPYVDIAPEQQRQQLLSAAQHAEVNATVNTPVSRQRMMMSLQNVVRYSDLDIQLAVGEGASASVYMAIHRPTGRRLAVKRVNLEPLCLDARKAFGKSGNLFTYACDSARAQQLRYIIVRELQVLHLTYRSPFMVKVYNAFYLPDIAALDIVMEFMHYGSIDDLAKCLQRHAQREAQRRTSTNAITGTHTDQGETNREAEGKGQYVKGTEAYSIPEAMQVKQGEHVVTSNTNRTHDSHTAEVDAISLQKSEAFCGSSNTQTVMPFTGVTARYLTEGTNTTLQHHASVDGPLSPDYTPNNPNAPTAAQTHNTSDAFVTAVTPVSAPHDATQSSRNAKRPLPLALPTLATINSTSTGSSSAGGSTPHIMPDTASPLTDKTPSVTSLPGMEEELCGVCERVVAVVGEQLLCGVRDMHARNFIHRDIKPGNVLVNEHAVVKLSDFGLSQRCSDAAGVKGRGQRRHTGSNSDNTQCHTHRGRRGGKRKKTTTPGNPPRQAHHCDGVVVEEEDGLAGITPQHPLAADMQASGERSVSQQQQQQQMCSSVSLIASDSTHSTSCSSSSSSSLTSMEDSSSSSSSSTSSSCEADAGGKTGCNAYACDCDDEEDDEDEDDVHCSGTLNYMSPERLRGEPHGKPSDIWAVGVTLAEFAVGSYPYNLHDLTDIFDRLYRMEQPIDFAPFNARRVMPLSAVFQDFIRLATLAAPSERPTAHELLEHPFFKQWSTPFDLKSYLAARVPAPETKKRES